MRPALLRLALAAGALVTLAACFIPLAKEFQQAPDFDRHGIRRIAAMPAANEELDLGAPDVVAMLVRDRLPERGYDMVPAAEVEAALGRLGIHDGGELARAGRDRHRQICEATGANGLLYPTIHQWNTVTLGAYNEIVVEVSFRLIACDSQREIWMARDDRKRNTVDINPARMLAQTLTAAQLPYVVVAEEVVFNCIDSLPEGPG